MVAWPCMCQKQKPSPWKVLQQQVKHGETSCFLSPFSRWQCEYLFQGISNDLFEGLGRNLFQGAVDTFFKVLPSICEEAATCQTFSSKTLQLRRSSRSRLRPCGVCSHIWRKGGCPTPSLPQRLLGGHRRLLQPCSGMPNPPFPPPRICTKHIGTLWPFSRSLRGGGPWSASGRPFCEPQCRPRRWSWHRPPPGPFSRRASSLLAQHRLFQDSCASRQQQLACLPFSRKILPFSRYQLQWDLPPFSRSLDLRRSCCSLLLAFFFQFLFQGCQLRFQGLLLLDLLQADQFGLVAWCLFQGLLQGLCSLFCPRAMLARPAGSPFGLLVGFFKLFQLLLSWLSSLFQGCQLLFHFSWGRDWLVCLLQGRPLDGLPSLPPWARGGPTPSCPFLVVFHPFSRNQQEATFSRLFQAFFKAAFFKAGRRQTKQRKVLACVCCYETMDMLYIYIYIYHVRCVAFGAECVCVFVFVCLCLCVCDCGWSVARLGAKTAACSTSTFQWEWLFLVTPNKLETVFLGEKNTNPEAAAANLF